MLNQNWPGKSIGTWDENKQIDHHFEGFIENNFDFKKIEIYGSWNKAILKERFNEHYFFDWPTSFHGPQAKIQKIFVRYVQATIVSIKLLYDNNSGRSTDEFCHYGYRTHGTTCEFDVSFIGKISRVGLKVFDSDNFNGQSYHGI